MCISTIYMSDTNMSPARAKLFGEYEHIGDLTPEAQAAMARQWRELDKSEQMWAADFEDYMTMLLSATAVGGVHHIGFGDGWAGGGGLPVIADILARPRAHEPAMKPGSEYPHSKT